MSYCSRVIVGSIQHRLGNALAQKTTTIVAIIGDNWTIILMTVMMTHRWVITTTRWPDEIATVRPAAADVGDQRRPVQAACARSLDHHRHRNHGCGLHDFLATNGNWFTTLVAVYETSFLHLKPPHLKKPKSHRPTGLTSEADFCCESR